MPNRSYFETHYKANEAILSAFKSAGIAFQTLPALSVGRHSD